MRTEWYRLKNQPPDYFIQGGFISAPGTPTGFLVEQANQQILVSWNLSAGATSYIVERSEDNVTFSSLATVSGSPLATQYLDTSVVLGTQYWYRVAASNGTASGYTPSASAISTPAGEMTLSQIRLAAQQRADRVNSNFVSKPEWRNYINQSMFELYDLLTTVYERYNVATPAAFITNGNEFIYELPNGTTQFIDGLTNQTYIPRPFYKLLGVDLAINTANNAWVTLTRYNFNNRNQYVYPNSSSTIYGVFNMQYELVGTNKIQFIPTPTSNQKVRIWYIPRLKELLLDTDTTDIGISGWIEYVVVKAAYYALTKEEADTNSLVMQLGALQKRIEESAANRDIGMPETINDVATSGTGRGWGGGFGGPRGGY